MRLALLMSVLLLLSAFAFAAVDPKAEPLPTPLMRTVEPYTAKVGTEVLVSGDNLGTNVVAEVYLMANNKNFKVEVTSQGETGGEVRLSRSELEGSGWRIVIPAEVGTRLADAGAPPTP